MAVGSGEDWFARGEVRSPEGRLGHHLLTGGRKVAAGLGRGCEPEPRLSHDTAVKATVHRSPTAPMLPLWEAPAQSSLGGRT